MNVATRTNQTRFPCASSAVAVAVYFFVAFPLKSTFQMIRWIFQGIHRFLHLKPSRLLFIWLLTLSWWLGCWFILSSVFTIKPDQEGLIRVEWTIQGEFPDLTQFELALPNTLMFGGWMLGSLTIPALSDLYGRRMSSLIAGLGSALSLLVQAMARQWMVYLAGRFLMGWSIGGIGIITYVWGSELSNSKNMIISGAMFQLQWSVAGLFLPWLAMTVPYWRDFLSVIAAVSVLLLLAMILVVPESPRWLALHNIPQNEAQKIFWNNLDSKLLGKENDLYLQLNETAGEESSSGEQPIYQRTSSPIHRRDRTASSHLIVVETGTPDVNVEDEPPNRPNRMRSMSSASRSSVQTSVALLFSSSYLIKTLVLFLLWFTNAFIYYGISLSAGLLPGNVYWLSFLLSLLSIPGQLASIPLSKHLTLNQIQLYSFLGLALSFLMMMIACIIQQPIMLQVFALAGQFLITLTFTLCYRVTTTIYDTRVRAVGMGAGVFMGKCGALMCPMVVLLDSIEGEAGVGFGWRSLLVWCVLCFATALSMLLANMDNSAIEIDTDEEINI